MRISVVRTMSRGERRRAVRQEAEREMRRVVSGWVESEISRRVEASGREKRAERKEVVRDSRVEVAMSWMKVAFVPGRKR